MKDVIYYDGYERGDDRDEIKALVDTEDEDTELLYEDGELTEDTKELKSLKEKAKKSEKSTDFVSVMNDYNSDDPCRQEMAMNAMLDHLRYYVYYIIKKRYSTYAKSNFEDMVQSAMVGIFREMPKYDPVKSIPSTFFHPHIIHEIQTFIETNVHKTTHHYGHHIKKVKAVMAKFEKEQRPCTPIDISIETGIPTSTIHHCLEILNNQEISMETPLDGEDLTLGLSLPSFEKTPEQAYIEKETAETVRKAVRYNLDAQSAKIIEMRFGLSGGEALSPKRISVELGIPLERVNRSISMAVCKLHQDRSMRSLYPDSVRSRFVETENNEDIVPLIPEEDVDFFLDNLEDVVVNF